MCNSLRLVSFVQRAIFAIFGVHELAITLWMPR